MKPSKAERIRAQWLAMIRQLVAEYRRDTGDTTTPDDALLSALLRKLYKEGHIGRSDDGRYVLPPLSPELLDPERN
jgi:hypothetical protein